MKKIKEINIVFVHHDRYHESIDFPFINWIYTKYNPKYIETIENWSDHWIEGPFNSFDQCNYTLWELYARSEKHDKFLFL
jgi:hypothetical protein